MEPKFDIDVQLSGRDENAFFIIGRVSMALARAGATKEQVSEFRDDAMSGNYDHVLQTCMKWVHVF